jgi:serine/threonine-protein kinase
MHAKRETPENDKSTVVDPGAAPPRSRQPDSAPELEPNTSLSALAIGEVIGEGGMGVVRAATQLSLARGVAVKATHPGASENDALRMLREAWVTGFLEHPGVVPVYDIAKGRDGPVVVMRRIEGMSWSDCLKDEKWAAESGARDLLEQNLRVFVRICEIVEFAHSKGVIHRDIKPGNVMIGAFGEVYLLDWGLALALGGEAERHIASTATTREIGGTLAYAAPEMFDLVDAPFSERTDIYMLGAMLYELTTGSRPHSGSDAERLVSIDASPPPIPEHVPSPLAGTIRRAMERLPHLRHEAVAQVRLAVLAYLSSREATVLIERELTRDPRRAEVLLDEAYGIAPELAARVRQAADAQRTEEARLAQLAHDHDHSIGRRARRIVIVLLGVSWAVTLPLGERIGPVTHARFAVGSIIQLVALAVAYLVAPGLRKTLYNRRILSTIAVVELAQIGLFSSASVFGASVAFARTQQIGIWATVVAMLAITLDRRYWPMTGVATAAFAIAVVAPQLRPYVAVISAMGVVANVALVGSSGSSK